MENCRIITTLKIKESTVPNLHHDSGESNILDFQKQTGHGDVDGFRVQTRRLRAEGANDETAPVFQLLDDATEQ